MSVEKNLLEETSLQNDESEEDIQQIRDRYKINFVGAVSVIVGVVIGSGIFATPTVVIKMTGSVGMALIIWTVSGIISFSMALTFSELGTMFPKSGGIYVYLKEGFGDLMAFTYSLIMNIIIGPAGRGISCLILSEYIIKSVAGNICDKALETLSMKLLSAFVLGFLTAVNIRSTKLTTRTQIIYTILKVTAIAMLIITGFYTLAIGKTENFENAFEGTTTSASRIAYALNGGLWAFGGSININNVIEEVKKPNRTLPLALISSKLLITALYLLVNIAYISALTQEEIESTNAVALTLANRMYGPMAWVIPFFVSCSILGNINGIILGSGWKVFSSARERQLPQYLELINKKSQTPVPALLTTTILAWLFLIPEASTFASLLRYTSFFMYLFAGLATASLLWLRYKKPHLKRPFKVPLFFPVISFLGCAFQVSAPFIDNPIESTYCLLVLFSAVPIYYLVYVFKLPKFILQANGTFTRWVQLILVVDFDTSRLRGKLSSSK